MRFNGICEGLNNLLKCTLNARAELPTDDPHESPVVNRSVIPHVIQLAIPTVDQ